MRAPDHLPPEVRECLKQRKQRADRARLDLIHDLAKRTLSELAAMPQRTWDRLGPQGILELIRVHRDFANLAPASPQVSPVRKSARQAGIIDLIRQRRAHWRRTKPLPVIAATALLRGSVAAVVLAAATLPAREIATRAGWLDRPAHCPRLDRWTGGCVYFARADALTLERVAHDLNKSVADLVAANPNLLPGRPLGRGTKITIPLRPLLSSAR